MALFEHSELYFWRNGSLVERCGTNEKGHDKMKREREREGENERKLGECFFIHLYVCLFVHLCVYLCVSVFCYV